MNAQRSETEFVDGLRVYAPHEKAPDYIIANVVIEHDTLVDWMADRGEEKTRIVIKRSQGGKLYAAVDTYQRDSAPRQRAPQPEQTGGFEDDDIPF